MRNHWSRRSLICAALVVAVTAVMGGQPRAHRLQDLARLEQLVDAGVEQLEVDRQRPLGGLVGFFGDDESAADPADHLDLAVDLELADGLAQA